MCILLSLALMLSAAAQTQDAASATTPQAKPSQPAHQALSVDSPIEAIMVDPEGKAVLDAEMPSLSAHPAYEQFKSMSLRQLQPYSGGSITDERLVAVQAKLAAIGRPQG